MTTSLWRYRLAGVIGGLMLAAGNFVGPLCVLSLGAFVPVLVLCLRDRKIGDAALSGMYMGLAFTFPQMIYLRMPVPVTVALLVEFSLILVALCAAGCFCLQKKTILGCFAFGATWFLLDWLNYTAIPIWGMAQTFARAWTSYPYAIGFISITGISGVLFFVGTLQAVAALAFADKPRRGVYGSVIIAILLIICIVDVLVYQQKPTSSIRVAAAGWIFDDLKKTNDPHTNDGFEKLFAEPARKAAEQGAAIFTTGELGFYIAKHDREGWMNRFAEIAQQNKLFLVVGYFNIDADENRIFFMNPQGKIEAEYTKTHLTPFEKGKKGRGCLQTVEVNAVKVGAMICQDDNFSSMTRYYGKLKTPVILCPTADWWTIKDAHLQAVRARAIECHYGIVRGAANGISAIIGPKGEIVARHDHYAEGPGVVIGDVPLYENITLFARFGHLPMAAVSIIVLVFYFKKERSL